MITVSRTRGHETLSSAWIVAKLRRVIVGGQRFTQDKIEQLVEGLIESLLLLHNVVKENKSVANCNTVSWTRPRNFTTSFLTKSLIRSSGALLLSGEAQVGWNIVVHRAGRKTMTASNCTP
jgi:hypothetical protein